MNKIYRYIVLINVMIVMLWGGYNLSYNASYFTFHKDNGYDRIKAEKFTYCNNPGSPELPVKFLNFIIPPNANAEYYEKLPSDLCIKEMPFVIKNKTLIFFGVPSSGDVELFIYNSLGQQLISRKIINARPGYYREVINVNNVSEGIYFLLIKQNDEKVNRKFIILK